VTDSIREIIQVHGRLPVEVSSLPDDANLYRAGMTSHASVNLMLALEDRFDVEFPDEMLTRTAFESVVAIRTALESLGVDPLGVEEAA
jgi:acyl carrier protein